MISSTPTASTIASSGIGGKSPRTPTFASSNSPGAASGAPRSLKYNDESRGFKGKCKKLSNDAHFTTLTTVLTLYALFGDDIRLSSTDKDNDILFNVLTVFCLFIFLVEIVAASVGKEEYFGSFFFWLDALSTASLVFDLTWVSEELFGTESGEGGAEGSGADASGSLRAGRASRAGARAGRVVRIIRLIRLVKLYRHAVEHNAKKQQEKNQIRVVPGDGAESPEPEEEDDEEDKDREEEDIMPQANENESRVGKKLSEMTTRRVIVLVLAMLFLLPQFQYDVYGEDLVSSAQYGLDWTYQRWRTWCNSVPGGCIQNADDPAILAEGNHEDRLAYEEAYAQYVYYHNIFSRKQTCEQNNCNAFMWHLFWVGVAPKKVSKTGASSLATLANLNPATYEPSWDTEFNRDGWFTNLGKIPPVVQNKLSQPFSQQCSKLVGTSLIDDDVGDDIRDGPPTFCPKDLRFMEVEYFNPHALSKEENDDFVFVFIFDKRPMVRLEAVLNSFQTIFIVIVLCLGAMFFSKDANILVLNPIERMIAKMEKIRDNPLYAMRLGDEEYKREELERKNRKEAPKRWWKPRPKVNKEPMETVVLEKTIIKLGGLLALGFGEAGAEIIGQNMKGSTSAGVDAMIPGQKVESIFGFCSIFNFTEATEVLQDQVMLFVNQIGEIVHGCVDDYHGAPNKNIGDAFLLVWRLTGVESAKQKKLADMSVMSFIKMLAEINKSPVLAEYRGHPGLLQRMQNYRVQMGFGLHYGWAIEGAIGSEFKIDASYLSPNVNMASRLEAATKQFGVAILISHWLIELCTKELMKQCRLIDNVTVKGSKQPMRLYTIDLDFMSLAVEYKNLDNVVKNRFKARQLRETRKMEKWADEYKVWEMFFTDSDLCKMRQRYILEFFQRFDMAYRNYEAGEWAVARDMLETTRFLLKGRGGEPMEDGPSSTLLSYMREFDYQSPPGWPGYRELTEK